MTLTHLLVALAVLPPAAAALVVFLRLVLGDVRPAESTVARVMGTGLALSIAGDLGVLAQFVGVARPPVTGDLEFGDWLHLGEFVILAVVRLDAVSVSLAIFSSCLTAIIARFSRTYLHKEPGFIRFFALLGVFATGTQLIALAAGLELFFAGWELVGIASAFFIGFFHERDEPIRSAIRAFATYRLADAGLLIATVATFALLGSARFSALDRAATLPSGEATLLALLFLLSAMGKSAQLPFSGWLPRAMEGPTPSSALFYGAVSIHAGLFLVLRVWPVFAASPVACAVGVAVGLATAVYSTTVARVHTDAKGALAHATLAQVGLILAEICLGWTTLALVHLLCHALLRLGQYLKAPNMIHDAHRVGHLHARHGWLARQAPRAAAWLYAFALHRGRLDDLIDTLFAPVLAVAGALDRADRWLRRTLSFEAPE